MATMPEEEMQPPVPVEQGEAPVVREGDRGPSVSNAATPEEQALYNKIIEKAMQIMYAPKMFDKVVDMLDGDGQDPRNGLAAAASMIVLRVAQAAEEGGERLSPVVLYHAGQEIFSQLADISDRAGISDYANDPDSLEGAYFMAIDQVIDQLGAVGELNKEQAERELAELKAMDERGELEKLFSDLAGADEVPAPEDEEDAPQGMVRGRMN